VPKLIFSLFCTYFRPNNKNPMDSNFPIPSSHVSGHPKDFLIYANIC